MTVPASDKQQPCFGEVREGQTFLSEGQQWVKISPTLARPVLRSILGESVVFEQLSDIDSIDQVR